MVFTSVASDTLTLNALHVPVRWWRDRLYEPCYSYLAGSRQTRINKAVNATLKIPRCNLKRFMSPSVLNRTGRSGGSTTPSTGLRSGLAALCFPLVIPPPNVTGSLHIGHLLDHTVMDVAVRWHRMKGENTLWLPGTDHAGIATQMVVERQLAKEKLTRVELGREEFERRVWQWKEEYGGLIKHQIQREGASVDWSRERFTMDAGLSRAVRETFVRLWEAGLIYRGDYMVNWCPGCHTAISDVETVHEAIPGHLWHIRYGIVGSDQSLDLATTRPETMLGDTAVAVHPDDTRYQHLVGKTVRLPLAGREIPVVADSMVDPKFGTGVVKITPAHDPNDFEAGKRHHLPLVRVIGPDARMTAEAGRMRTWIVSKLARELWQRLSIRANSSKPKSTRSISRSAIARRPSLNRLFRLNGSSR